MKDSDDDIARRLAHGAGELLLTLQKSGMFTGKLLGDEGDRIANTWLMNELRLARPEDAILSEEEKDDPARLAHDRVWIIDPLDGTREYSEGRSDFAVHVALAVNGFAKIGAVALPALGATLSTGMPIAIPRTNHPPKMLISRTRPAHQALMVAKHLGADLVPMGSAGAKAMAVVRGEADIYLHTGGQYEWDNCAPVAVAQFAGLHCSRIDGSPLYYNNANNYLPDLLICHKDQAETIISLVKKY
jgi:3'(2'), 5'-bisphosphate nucleotidase